MKRYWLVSLLMVAATTPALAFDFGLKIEPALAIPLGSPQSDIYQVGGAASVKGLIGVGRYVDVMAGFGAVGLPAQAASGNAGGAFTAGGGFRLKRPHDAESAMGISPWIDTDALYVRTGDLDRFGWDVGAGLAVPLGKARTYWIGPFVRYLQIGQPDRAGFDNTDAKILMVGLSLEAEGQIGRQGPSEPAAALACVPDATEPSLQCPPMPAALPDRDGDGVPDRFDHCPDAPGPIDGPGAPGCPVYKKVVVKKDKLELKEKILFAWDQGVIHESSYPLLDEVVLALKDNKSFHVTIEGNTDSSGTEEHNQILSQSRAQAVFDYLVSHGIAADRLKAKGFSSSVPTDSNVTAAGRENNRRVEFVVEFVIVRDGGAQ